MEPTNWLLVALGAGIVAALLGWVRAAKPDYRGSDAGPRFASNEVDRLLDRLNARRPKTPILTPKGRRA